MKNINTLLALASLLFLFSTSNNLAEEQHAHDHEEKHETESEDSAHSEEHDHEENGGEESEHEHEHDDEEAAEIEMTDEQIDKFGVQTTVVSAGMISQSITSYGRLDASPDTVSHIRARFPGQIIRVHAALGDHVKRGDMLAEVESNESLRRYAIRSPINGQITRQHASNGDLAENQVLFEVADFSQLWAELHLFPSQRGQVKSGAEVTVFSDNIQIKTQLGPIIPSSDATPFVITRSQIDNANGRLYPGLMIRGEIVINAIHVPLRVANQAIQIINDQPVVFVRDGHHFEPRPISVGRKDNHFSEIVAGLNPGESYVIENSFLFKAELEKSSAGHHHH